MVESRKQASVESERLIVNRLPESVVRLRHVDLDYGGGEYGFEEFVVDHLFEEIGCYVVAGLYEGHPVRGFVV